ncbi:MAG: cell division protein FtsL [Gammaproteobacteria bacterium]|nr:cell division protein FtsL [Gammaproteobacteria bacterium]
MTTATSKTKGLTTWVNMIVVACVLSSALALVYAKHVNRNLFIELQETMSQRNDLNVEWGRLQLEQSTFTTHSYIENRARQELGMVLPQQNEIVMVRP